MSQTLLLPPPPPDDWMRGIDVQDADDSRGRLLPPPPPAQSAGDSGDRAVAALRGAAGMTPEQAASDLALGGELGIPPDMVGMNREDARRLQLERKIRQSGSVTLQEWIAQTPYNAAMAAGEPDNWTAVFDTASGLGALKSLGKTAARFPGHVAESAYDFLGFGLGGLDYLEEKAAQGLRLTGLTDGERTGWFGAARDWARANAGFIREEYLGSDLLSLPEELRGRLWEHPEYLLDPEYLTYQLGEAASSAAIMLAGGAGYI